MPGAETTAPLRIRPFEDGDDAICERVLRALPEWFGIESALVQYVADASAHATWIATGTAKEGPLDVGFITVRRHFPQSAEINCLAVRPEFHRTGVGRALTTVVEDRLARSGVSFLQVKTLGPTRIDEHYARTRRFYEAMGFLPLEEFAELWPGNPALQLVKRLAPVAPPTERRA